MFTSYGNEKYEQLLFEIDFDVYARKVNEPGVVVFNRIIRCYDPPTDAQSLQKWIKAIVNNKFVISCVENNSVGCF